MQHVTKPYTVLRPICVAGERVEVGETVQLTKVQYSELSHAGKVGPLKEKAKKTPAKPAPAAPAPAPAADPAAAAGSDAGTSDQGPTDPADDTQATA